MPIDTFSKVESIEALYIGYFGRAGEPGGVEYWVSRMDAGMTIEEIAASFAEQPEAKGQHPFLADPANTDAESFITSLYEQLLSRVPDANGFGYWVGQLEAANGDPIAIGLLIAQFIAGTIEANGDADLIQLKVEAAQFATEALAAEGLTGTDENGQALPDINAFLAKLISEVVDQESLDKAKEDITEFAENGGEVPPPGPGPGPGPGPQPAQKAVVVTDSGGALVGSYDTIQEAVDAASDGATITIRSGTYTEQVLIEGFTNLTIVEDQAGNVVIRAPSTLSVSGRSDARSLDLMSIVQVRDSTGVKINGITVDGDDGRAVVGGATFVGISYEDSSGTLSGVSVSDIRDPDNGQTSAQRGFGIFFESDNGSALPDVGEELPTFVVTSSTIESFQKGAIYVYGGDVKISGNTMTGGSETIAQNGIVAFGSTGIVGNNTVSNIGYSTGWSDAGFIGISNRDLDVSNTTVNVGGGIVMPVDVQASSVGGSVSNTTVNGSENDDVINLGVGAYSVHAGAGSDTTRVVDATAETHILYRAVSESGFDTASIDTLDLLGVTEFDPVTIHFIGSDFDGAREALAGPVSAGGLLYVDNPTIGSGVQHFFIAGNNVQEVPGTPATPGAQYISAYVRHENGNDISYDVYVDANGDGHLNTGDMQFQILGEIYVDLVGVFDKLPV